MTTEHNNFLTVISKEVALQYQIAVNLLKDAISDSISTSCSPESTSSPTELFGENDCSCPNSKVDQAMSSCGFLLYTVKVYERPGIY